MSTLAERQQELGLALMALGYPMKSAAAIVGNGTQENLCQPVTTGPKDHGSDGIFQWREKRLTNLQTLSGWDTLPVQAHFVMLELQASPGSQFYDENYSVLEAELRAGIKPLATLTLNFTDAYERPSELGRVPDKRIGYAEQAFAILERAVPTPLPSQPLPQTAPIPLPSPSFPPITLPTTGVSAVPPIDPALIATLVQLFAPIAESLVAGIVKGIITQIATMQAAQAKTAGLPALPGLDPNILATIQATIQASIAAEIAKLNPTLGAK
jgi:hypothetical protein